jgi:hypothetical protein
LLNRKVPDKPCIFKIHSDSGREDAFEGRKMNMGRAFGDYCRYPGIDDITWR